MNLAGLLYAALVGRWPGTEGSAVPPAPAEHGRPLRPRQVRAGVPRPLDAICERVLNAGPHTRRVPIETAHEVYAALSDYIGDPAARPPSETGPPRSARAPTGRGRMSRGRTGTGDDPGRLGRRHRRPAGHRRVPRPGAGRPGGPRPGGHPGRRPGVPRRRGPTPAGRPTAGRPQATRRSLGHPRTLRRAGRIGPAPRAAVPEPPERPLFADDRHATGAAAVPALLVAGGPDRAVPARARSTAPATAGAAGWGPDAGHSPVDRPAPGTTTGGTACPADPGCGWPWCWASSSAGGRRRGGVRPRSRARHGPTPSRGAGGSASPAPQAEQPPVRHRRGHRLRPAGRPAGGELRPRPAGGRRQARHRLADQHLLRPHRRPQERRRPAGRPRRARPGRRRPAHPAGQPHLGAGPRRARRRRGPHRAPTAWTRWPRRPGRRHPCGPRRCDSP